MSMGIWQQKMLRDQLGVRVGTPPIDGLQEAIIEKVGTATISIAGQTFTAVPTVWVTFPLTMGTETLFGPVTYQTPSGFTPVKGTPCIVAAIGNSYSRLHVISFPTAT